MIIGRLLSPIHSLGPGERVGLWTQGCTKHCSGCVAKELQPFEGKNIPEETLAQVLVQVGRIGNCTGLTISGGDPFEQAPALLNLLQQVRWAFADILVYTGYTLEEIHSGVAGEAGIACLQLIDVLIDGRYQQALNTPDCILRGSQNQKIHFLNPEMVGTYAGYLAKGRILETFAYNGETVVTGILNKEEDQ